MRDRYTIVTGGVLYYSSEDGLVFNVLDVIEMIDDCQDAGVMLSYEEIGGWLDACTNGRV